MSGAAPFTDEEWTDMGHHIATDYKRSVVGSRLVASVNALRSVRNELRRSVLKAEEQCTLAVVDRDKALAARDSLKARLDDLLRPQPDNPNGTFVVTAELGTAIRERDEALTRVAELERLIEAHENHRTTVERDVSVAASGVSALAGETAKEPQ